jgi:lipopolysaccharide transport system permease protein
LISSEPHKFSVQNLPGENLDDHAAKNVSVIIEPSKLWVSFNLSELYSYRELLYFLALRDIKIRYKQTFIGVAWVLLQPIFTTLIFSILFSNIAAGKDQSIPYPLFAFSGFTIWAFVNAAVNNSSNSLVNHSNLITKVYFPRLIIPVAAVAANLLDLALGLASLLVVMFVYQVVPTWKIIFAPVFLLLIFVISLGLGLLLSAINVRYRDVKHILPFVLQLWLFVTPIFYSLNILPAGAVWAWKLNPLTGALEGFRAAIFGQEIDVAATAVSAAVSIAIFVFALYVFHRMEDGFADVI